MKSVYTNAIYDLPATKFFSKLRRMKLTHFSMQLPSLIPSLFMAILTLVMNAPSAHADLVLYDHSNVTFAFTVHLDAKGQEQISVLTCPANLQIQSLRQCANPLDLISAAEFGAYIKSLIIQWASENPNQALDPLSAAEVAAFLQMDQLRNQSPANPAITTTPAFQAGAAVEQAIDQVVTALIDFIQKKDPKTNAVHFFDQALMKGSLISLVMDRVKISTGTTDLNFEGIPYHVSINANGSLILAAGGETVYHLDPGPLHFQYSSPLLAAAPGELFILGKVSGIGTSIGFLIEISNLGHGTAPTVSMNLIEKEFAGIVSLRIDGDHYLIQIKDASGNKFETTITKNQDTFLKELNWTHIP
jgi:hypothetical protein